MSGQSYVINNSLDMTVRKIDGVYFTSKIPTEFEDLISWRGNICIFMRVQTPTKERYRKSIKTGVLLLFVLCLFLPLL